MQAQALFDTDRYEHRDDGELLELILGSRVRAQRLTARFGGFAETMAASPTLLLEEGLTPAAVKQLKLVEAAAIRITKAKVINRPALSSWSALLDYCMAAMGRDQVEQFRVFYLDRKNVLIADVMMQRGTVDHTPVYPREIVKRALELNASAVILAHNHPSGDPTPSQADIAMTRQIVEACKALGLAVHDHLVIGRKGHASFKALGLL